MKDTEAALKDLSKCIAMDCQWKEANEQKNVGGALRNLAEALITVSFSAFWHTIATLFLLKCAHWIPESKWLMLSEPCRAERLAAWR